MTPRWEEYSTYCTRHFVAIIAGDCAVAIVVVVFVVVVAAAAAVLLYIYGSTVADCTHISFV